MKSLTILACTIYKKSVMFKYKLKKGEIIIDLPKIHFLELQFQNVNMQLLKTPLIEPVAVKRIILSHYNFSRNCLQTIFHYIRFFISLISLTEIAGCDSNQNPLYCARIFMLLEPKHQQLNLHTVTINSRNCTL